jgi:catechol 2,3-dioxygenase-like lactoylglutathione lyase family enzyme
MPIDHAAVNVTDLERSKAFYSEALKPLGFTLMYEVEGYLGFGDAQMPSFGVVEREPAGGGHIAISAPDRSAVNAFYDAAMSAGGTDNGPPGVREHYHPSYYAAYVRDPDGNNLEAVVHRPE